MSPFFCFESWSFDFVYNCRWIRVCNIDTDSSKLANLFSNASFFFCKSKVELNTLCGRVTHLVYGVWWLHIQQWNVMCTYDTENILGLVWALKGKETTITIINIWTKYFLFFSHSTKKITTFFIYATQWEQKQLYKSPSTSFAFS